jgi:aminoglycoside phosphotransferase (APT) family kinase protein
VLVFLGDHDIAAPALILRDETSRILGRPAIVISLVDGDPVVQPDETQSWAEQLVSAIVKVHSLPVTNELKSIVKPLFDGYDRSFSKAQPSDRKKMHPLGPPALAKTQRNLAFDRQVSRCSTS